MKKFVLAIIIVLYIFAGVGGLFISFRLSSGLKSEVIQKRLAQMQLASGSTENFLEKLPSLFQEYPAASMILVLNQKTRLLGSLYEPSRLSRQDYDEILKTYKTTELSKYVYVRIVTANGSSVWVVGRKNADFSDFLSARFDRSPVNIAIFGAYMLVLLVLILSLVFDKPEETPVAEKKEPVREKPPEQEKPAARQLPSSDKYLANKIMLLMDSIEKKYATSKVAFYSREGGRWKHILEKSGNIVVRGDAAIEYLPVEITQIADEHWREPLISQDRRILFVPLYYRNNLFGLLRIHFTGLASDLSNESLDRLLSLCSNYSHAVFMQRIYDKAISDPETDFYNYPYFYFMVKEKLSAARQFAVVVFEVADFNRTSPESARAWALGMITQLTEAGLKPVIPARLERSRFALLYDVGNKNGEISDLNSLNQIPGLIRKSAEIYFKNSAHLKGGFFIRPSSYEDAEAFMQRLDYLIINSTFSAYSMDFDSHATAEVKHSA